MWTLVKPLSQNALKEVLFFKKELEKYLSSPIELMSREEAKEKRARILTWNSREKERLNDFSEVIVLLPGVDTRLRTLRPEPRPYDVLRVVTCLDVEKKCGFDEALALFQAFPHNSWHWYIVGEPVDEAYFEELTEKFERLGWDDQVTFLGPFPIEERIKLYMNMDLAYHPSSVESLAFSVLESLQVGLPVASTPVGYAKELFEGDEDTHLIRDTSSTLAFFLRYMGRKETCRKKRDHPLLKRKWSQAAEELEQISAEILSD